MIIEQVLSDNSNLIRRFSDQGYMIRQDQTGREYSEAIDVITSGFTYTETDIPMDPETYAQKFSIVNKVISLEEELEEAKNTNNMLTECILEISELLYE